MGQTVAGAVLMKRRPDGPARKRTEKEDKYLDAADLILRHMCVIVKKGTCNEDKIKAGKVATDLIVARFRLPAWGATPKQAGKQAGKDTILDALTPDQRAEIIRTLETQQGQALADERKPEATPEATDTPSAGS